MIRAKEAWRLLKQAAYSWIGDYAPSMGAALAYYTLFSIAPLLIIVIAVAGFVFGDEAARGFLIEQDREIAEKSGRPPLAIKGITRAGVKKK